MGNENRYYDDEFNASAVKMIVEKSINKFSIQRSGSILALSKTVAKRSLEFETENRKLKKELQNANDTVEILKKSVAIPINSQR